MALFSLNKRGITGWKRILIILSIIIISFIAICIIFISPIAKYAIEKYGPKYIGREIKTGVVIVNPFSGYIHIGNLKIFEPQSDSIFLSASSISTNLAISKLFSKTYEIEYLTFDKPHVMVIKDKERFNFTDLQEKGDTTRKEDNAKKEPLHLNVLNVRINNGTIRYHELQTPVDYIFQKLYFESDGKYWDTDTINAHFSFIPGKGPGGVKGDFWTNLDKKDFRLSSEANKLNVDLFEQYLKDFANYGTIRALFSFNMKAVGNFNDQKAIKLRGNFEIDDFHFGKDPNDDYASFEKFKATISDLEPLNQKYFFDSLQLKKPFFVYEMYDKLSNLEYMFGANGENIKEIKEDPEKFNLILELADYIKVLFEDIIQSDYKINNLDVENANIQFIDYSLAEKFSLSLNPFNIKANLVSKDNRKVNIVSKGEIKPYGSFIAEVGMDPQNPNNYYLTYNFNKIPATLFNPYTLTYSSFPLDRGIIQMTGDWKILGDQLQSMNHFIVVDPRVSQRVRKKDTKWLPMPLIMAIVRERGNVIDYRIPITGSLKNPNFHLRDVVFDVLKNIFIKPPTTPYGLEIKNTETKIEKSLLMDWPFRQTNLKNPEERFARKIADFLKDNKEASINVKPYTYQQKEKEYILFFEAKKKYYFAGGGGAKGPLNEKDSLKIDKMSTKDSAFVKYLNKHVKDSLVYTRQEKCRRLLGDELVDKKFDQLLKARREVFLNYFKKEKTEDRVNFLDNENIVPFNGFSYYRIQYKGDMPKSLEKAYKKLQEYNQNPPREKYQPIRKEEKPKI